MICTSIALPIIVFKTIWGLKTKELKLLAIKSNGRLKMYERMTLF